MSRLVRTTTSVFRSSFGQFPRGWQPVCAGGLLLCFLGLTACDGTVLRPSERPDDPAHTQMIGDDDEVPIIFETQPMVPQVRLADDEPIDPDGPVTALPISGKAGESAFPVVITDLPGSVVPPDQEEDRPIAPEPRLVWAHGFGSEGYDGGLAVTSSGDGGTFVSGYFETTSAPDPDADGDHSDHDTNAFVARYQPNGDIDWIRLVGGSDADYSTALAATEDGGVVVVGVFGNGLASFQSASGGENPEVDGTLISEGMGDVFIARYDRDGVLQWVTSAGGPCQDVAFDVAVSRGDSVFVAGAFECESTFGAGTLRETTLVSTGGTDAFLARINADGSLQWVRRVGGPGVDFGRAVASFDDGGVVFAGKIRNTVTFDSGLGVPYSFQPAGGEDSSGDLFLARYDAAGVITWARSAGGEGSTEVRAVAISPDETIALTGRIGDCCGLEEMHSTVVFGYGEAFETELEAKWTDTFVALYAPYGGLIWATNVAGTGAEQGTDLAFTPDGGLVVTGEFDNKVVFDTAIEEPIELISAGERDLFMARFELDGSVPWARSEGGSADQAEPHLCTSGGEVWLTGASWGKATFGDGLWNFEAQGRSDVFVARYAAVIPAQRRSD